MEIVAVQPLTTSEFRVAMGDTDAARVIYFGAPLRWAERLVTTWLADSGNSTSEAIDSGYGMPAAHVDIDYKSPLRLDDIVCASLWLDRRSARSVTFRSEFTRAGTHDVAVVVRVTQVQVKTTAEGPVPVALRPGLAAALPSVSQNPTPVMKVRAHGSQLRS
jgi:acyl-CoA thioester hydrolase